MKKWNLYTTNQIKPRGWLLDQLKVQAGGLSGNLDKMWRDVRDSKWIGGEAEGWERVPYWLDGFIPLAYLLEDADMIARAKKYIDAIVARQQPSGWICPCTEEEIPTYDTWAVQLITKTLTVYYECSGDERIPDVIYKALKNYYELLSAGTIRLFDWGKARWYETFIAINMTYARCGEAWLKDLARILREQGTDYATLTGLWKRPLNKWTQETHIVNLGMMSKYEAVSCDLLGEEYADLAGRLHDVLDTYNGTPVATFTGDECLSGLSPIQGTELCAVAEQMFSYELLYAYTGDRKWAEWLEMMAFNALPGTFSDDMWAHQYVQMSNQIACQRFPGKPLFRTNGYESHIFGLEPNYGCCTANLSQAWPKLTLSTFMHSGNTVLSAVPVPSELTCDDFTVSLETDYPFGNAFTYKIKAVKPFTFKVRVPSFARNLTIDGMPAETGDLLTFEIAEGIRVIRIAYDVQPKLVERPHGLKTVQCGSLVFSVPVAYEKVMLEYVRNDVERKFPYCDYEYVPKSDWNYTLSSDAFEVVRNEISSTPFSSEKPPVTVTAKARKIDWGLEDGYETVCAKIPESTEPISDEETISLYPYGCAKLRMTELPLLK